MPNEIILKYLLMFDTDFSIRSFRGGYDNNFTYLVTCMQTGIQFMVDAAVPVKTIEAHISNQLDAILITHTHGDHTAYLTQFLNHYPKAKYIGYKELIHFTPTDLFHPVDDKDRLILGHINIDVMHTPGHFPDSVCYKLGNILFTGDTLFVGRTGRTVNSYADIRELYHSVYDKILSLPGDILIYPGHDYGKQPTISIDENVRISPLLQAKDEEDFITRMADYETNR